MEVFELDPDDDCRLTERHLPIALVDEDGEQVWKRVSQTSALRFREASARRDEVTDRLKVTKECRRRTMKEKRSWNDTADEKKDGIKREVIDARVSQSPPGPSSSGTKTNGKGREDDEAQDGDHHMSDSGSSVSPYFLQHHAPATVVLTRRTSDSISDHLCPCSRCVALA